MIYTVSKPDRVTGGGALFGVTITRREDSVTYHLWLGWRVVSVMREI